MLQKYKGIVPFKPKILGPVHDISLTVLTASFHPLSNIHLDSKIITDEILDSKWRFLLINLWLSSNSIVAKSKNDSTIVLQ